MNALKAVLPPPPLPTVPETKEEKEEEEDTVAAFRSLETCYVLKEDVHTAKWLRATSVLIQKTQADSKLDQVRDVTLMMGSLAIFGIDPNALIIRTTPWFPAPLTEYGTMHFCNCPVTACFRWIAWLAHRVWHCALVALEIPRASLLCSHDTVDLKTAKIYAYGVARVLGWFQHRFRGHFAYPNVQSEQTFLYQAMGGLAQFLLAIASDGRSSSYKSPAERLQAIHQSIEMLEFLVASSRKLWVINTTLIQQLRGLYWAELGEHYKLHHAYRDSLWAFTRANAMIVNARFRDALVQARTLTVSADTRADPFDLHLYVITRTPVLSNANERHNMVLPDAAAPMDEAWLPNLRSVH